MTPHDAFMIALVILEAIFFLVLGIAALAVEICFIFAHRSLTRELNQDIDIETGVSLLPIRQPPLTQVVLRTRTILRRIADGHRIGDIIATYREQQGPAVHNGELCEIVENQTMESSTRKYNNDCVICIEEFNEKDTIEVMVSCQHSFHTDCINKWYLQKRNCPICRAAL